MLDLAPYLDRKPKQLSGGQRQRVAMGRAIVRQPQVFLMDEPLSNLDAKLRVQMRADIAKLQHDLGTTTIYVTHDQVEAMTMGDRVAVMRNGVLQQVADPQTLYDTPANLFVAGFIGTPPMNLLEANVSVNGGVTRRSSAVRRSRCRTPRSRAYPGASLRTAAAGRRRRAQPVPASRRRSGRSCRRSMRSVELVEALGGESIVYFRIDATAVREGQHEDEEEEVGGGRGRRRVRGRTSSRSIPAHVQLRLTEHDPGRRSTSRRCTSSTASRAIRSASAALVAVGVALVVAASAGHGAGRRAARVSLAQPVADSSLASDRIYFVMTDRYANGDPSNDSAGVDAARATSPGTTRSSTGYWSTAATSRA